MRTGTESEAQSKLLISYLMAAGMRVRSLMIDGRSSWTEDGKPVQLTTDGHKARTCKAVEESVRWLISNSHVDQTSMATAV